MTLIANEIALKHTFRRRGVTFIVSRLPTHISVDEDGEEVQAFSMPIASRLDQLLDDVLAKDPTPRTVELEF